MIHDLNLEFVRIPEDEFIIGSVLKKDKLAQPDEMPQHCLHVSDFYIMRFPVTNAQYYRFMQATGSPAPKFGWPEGRYPVEKADHPVVGVSYQDAVAFCKWASIINGHALRLPTEPEWEKAARGTDGRVYPWGDTWEAGYTNSQEAKLNGTTPVGQFSPQGDSPYGVAEMGGNVQEWCSSLFGRYPYDPADGRETLVYSEDPASLPNFRETGCIANAQAIEASLDKSVVRGGSWREEKLKSRCAYRGWAAPLHRSDDTGFRCVYEP
jgi:formylglycine-generating enzyme required for sulfatase activity